MSSVLVIIPTHSNTETLPQALRSIQQQSYEDLEVQVIADGATKQILEIAQEFAQSDARFRLQNHLKSVRRGEEHRHRSIIESKARYITYLADDDLFLPDHVEYLVANLIDKDFANPRPTFIDRDDHLWCIPTDISTKASRQWHFSKKVQNSISLSGVMHTKESYLRLEEGWAPTPESFRWTDLYMWRKFLSREDFRFTTTRRCTILKFAGTSNAFDEAKIAQNRKWFELMQQEGWLAKWDELVESTHQIAAARAHARMSESIYSKLRRKLSNS